MKAYQLKITIKDSHPPIWRRVIVPAGLSFSQLSVVLNEVMDWDGYHLFSFEFYNLGLRIEEIDEDYGFMDMDLDEASEVIIDAYLDREKRFTYVYDFGDDWRHAVVVEKIIDDYDKNYPVVLKYKGDSPIEDCGGIWGFYDKQRILEDPEDSEYEEISEWAPFGVAVEFDLEEKNERLEALCLTNKKSKPMLQNEIYEDLLKKNKGFKLIQGVNEHIRDTDFDEFEQWEEFAEAAEQLKQMEAYLEKLKSQVGNMYPKQLYNPENPTLKEIYQDYKKEHLVQMAKNHGLSGYSKFKKAELIDFLVYNVLDKDVMCRYFTFLSDEELAIIEKFSDPSEYKDATEEDLSNAMELFGGGYAGCHSLRDIIVPKEVLDAYKKNCDGEWRRLRREALELSYYLSAAAELYGICPMEKALEIYRKHTGKEIDEIKMYGFCQSIPETRKCYMYNGIHIVHKAFIDEELFEELKEQQEGKPYYMPTKKEALTLGKDGYLPFDDSMKALERFLDIFFGEDPGYAAYLCRFLQSIIRAGADIEEVVGFLEDNDVLGEVYDREAKAEFKQLLIKAWHRTRKMSDRGNLPKGMTRQERNGVKLAVENSGKADVLKFPVDVQRKIYPNDPCPCGSGKKYKKCCGRNE